MKKFLFIFALTGLLFSACSNTDDGIDEIQANPRAEDSSPFIITSPTMIYFTPDSAGTDHKSVNVKLGGLPSLGVLTSIKATVQGPDFIYFEATVPNLSLTTILSQLLGNGIDIDIAYTPSVLSPNEEHEAQLLIETSLLGMIAPVQTIVPLHGVYDPAPLELVSSQPEMGGTVDFVEEDPDTEDENGYVRQGYYNVTLNFNKPASLTLSSVNITVGGTAEIVGVTTSGNSVTFRIRDYFASIGLLTSLFFEPGAFTSTDGSTNTQPISYEYVVGERP